VNADRFFVAHSGISDELLGFIARFIHSVEQIEILCIFARAPAKTWTEEEVFKEIQSSRTSVAANLGLFCGRLLHFDAPTGYRFSPESPDLGRLALELVKTYHERRVTVINAIYREPVDPIRDFADAFKLRKDKKL